MANVLKAFQALLPASSLLVGQVVAFDGVELRIELPDGSLSSARGSSTVGATVYFRPGGAVEGDAPTLPFVDIDI